MDAKATGALIAARRKALGLTQKQLAERLLVSDKAVSKWEVGASYPEVTLLPPLAAILGLTVDELLAGEAPPAGESESGAPAEPPPEARLASQAYLADRLGSVDDKLLLAAVLLLLAAAYYGSLFGQMSALHNLVIGMVAYITCRVWHGKQCDRFAVLGLDTTVSRRRARTADRLFGIVWAVKLLLWWVFNWLAWLLSANELGLIVRYRIIISIGNVNVDSHHPWLLFYSMATVPLLLALTAVFAFSYRRMERETRFRPLAVGLPLLPALLGAGAVGWHRLQAALAIMPDYGEEFTDQDALGQAIADAGQAALTAAAAVLLVLTAVLLILRRVTHGRMPLVSAALLAAYAVIWLPSVALWMDIGYENFSSPYGTEEITIQLGGLATLLVLTALCAGIGLFADRLRRKPRPSAAPAP